MKTDSKVALTEERQGLSLKFRLLLPIIGIVLATFLLASTVALRAAERALISASHEKILNAAFSVGENIQEQINRAKADITYATLVPGIAQTLNPHNSMYFTNRQEFIKDTNALLARLGDIGGYYETFYVVTDKGMTLASSLDSTVGILDISNRDWFHAAMSSDAVIISDPFRSRITGDALMAVATKIRYGDYTGAIVGSMQIQNITRRSLQGESKTWLEPFIVSASGLTLAALEDSLIGTPTFRNAEWFPALKTLNRDLLDVEIGGVPKLVASYHLPGTQFYALAIADKHHVLAPIRNVTLVSYGALLAAILLSITVIYRAVNPVTFDIRRLALFARQIGEGKLDQHILLERNDELGALADSLEDMVNELKQMIVTAEDATRAKSDFLAHMSHEIRTPMNAILGMTYLGQQANPDPKQKNYLDKIQKAAESLLGIINDILDFSKIEAGKMRLENTDFSLANMVQSIRDLLAFRAQEKNLILDFSIDNALPLSVVGDSLRLAQVCINLCTNGIKFTESGSVTLRITVDEDWDETLLVHFAVQDTGIGLSEEQQAIVFEPFSQADGSTTRRFGGTGLGLAICKQIVLLMHGQIWVESVLGQGSTFHFTALLGRGTGQALPKDVSKEANLPKPKFEGVHVLLVEDNELNKEIAVELLQEMNIVPQVAANGAEALALCQEQAFDLVLMDIQMPVMDGLEATRRIRASNGPKAETIPIIAMTANAMSGDKEKSLAAGMTDYITKPIDPLELQRTLREWLPRSSLIPARDNI